MEDFVKRLTESGLTLDVAKRICICYLSRSDQEGLKDYISLCEKNKSKEAAL